MLCVGGLPKARQCLQSRVPDTELAPAREAYEDRIPISVSLGHVAPRRTGAQDPENAVDRSPLVRDSRTAFAPIGKQWIENAPFRVRQIATDFNAASSRKAALNQNSIPLSKTVNTA